MEDGKVSEKGMIERATAVGLIGNAILVAFKLYAGFVGRSGAMISDAIHSLSDVLATGLAYLGATIAISPADKSHPYGHEQVETLATTLIGGFLLVAGAGLGYESVARIVNGAYKTADPPSLLPVVAAIVSIGVKESMFWYTRRCAIILNSSAIMADAWHHRSDAFSSIGALIGIVGARLGCPILEPLAAGAISLVILKTAFDVFRGSVGQMVDAACDEDFENKIAEIVKATPGVERLDLLRTRKFGGKVFVEVEIAVDGGKTLYVAHRIAHETHCAVEAAFPRVKHVMVHVNPAQISDTDAML